MRHFLTNCVKKIRAAAYRFVYGNGRNKKINISSAKKRHKGNKFIQLFKVLQVYLLNGRPKKYSKIPYYYAKKNTS